MYTCKVVNNDKKMVGYGFSTYKEPSFSFDGEVTLKCHNVTIMKNAKGERVIIQEVKR